MLTMYCEVAGDYVAFSNRNELRDGRKGPMCESPRGSDCCSNYEVIAAESVCVVGSSEVDYQHHACCIPSYLYRGSASVLW